VRLVYAVINIAPSPQVKDNANNDDDDGDGYTRGDQRLYGWLIFRAKRSSLVKLFSFGMARRHI
jgi:hypothetical protein